MVLDPNSDAFKVDAYPDANFAGIYGHKNPSGTAYVNRNTGFIIKFAGCTVLWISKLHTKTALSTTESEIRSMDHCFRELFPIIDIETSLGKAVGLNMGDIMMNVYDHEDNEGSLVLDKMFSHKFTLRGKHYATTNIWFREEIVKRGINLLKIGKDEQLGDLFTKGMLITTFEFLCKKIMGWYISQIDRIYPRGGVLILIL